MPGACPFHPKDLSAKRVDGTHNDLDNLMMGSAGTRFGRNIGLDQVWPDPEPDLLTPSPREVSRMLMTRSHFLPAKSLNLLAAAWIQFEVHDWCDSEELSGIPGSPVDHHGALYAMTEEFTSVYRLHPLIPDDYRFQSLSNPEFSRYKTFMNIQGNGTRPFIREIGIENVLHSFGLAHPGAIALGNYPQFSSKNHANRR